MCKPSALMQLLKKFEFLNESFVSLKDNKHGCNKVSPKKNPSSIYGMLWQQFKIFMNVS